MLLRQGSYAGASVVTAKAGSGCQPVVGDRIRPWYWGHTQPRMAGQRCEAGTRYGPVDVPALTGPWPSRVGLWVRAGDQTCSSLPGTGAADPEVTWGPEPG